MTLGFTIAYAIIYFAGHYGAHILNLALRRVLVKNLRLAGLLVVALASVAHAYLIDAAAPSGISPLVIGRIQGEMAFGPALLVGMAVAARMWWQGRKSKNLQG